MAFNWTESNVEKLKAMWAKGMSARQIGEELGGISRNAVIGKAHRLGLSAQKEKKFHNPSKVPASLSTRKMNKVMHEIMHGTSQKIVSNDRLCQWPSGDPGEPSFAFCYKKAVPGRPYCKEHCEIAYRQNCATE